jgi:hypothetical protein
VGLSFPSSSLGAVGRGVGIESRLAESIADIQAELESLIGFDHFPELRQSEQLSVNDECYFVIRVGDPAAQYTMSGLEVSGLSLLDVPCGECFGDSSANPTKC